MDSALDCMLIRVSMAMIKHCDRKGRKGLLYLIVVVYCLEIRAGIWRQELTADLEEHC